ncbi:MAG: discoidin domain-containing protein, partial [Opitutales bacterium]|nr:discoidin domain-containing protein [Opitutales bacterium]
NGKWKFFFAKNPEEAKPEFFREKFDDKGWFDFSVPGTWQMNGFDHIYYANVHSELIFDPNGGVLEEYKGMDSPDNPSIGVLKPRINEIHRQSGIFRREFELKNFGEGRRYFIRFGAVKSGFKLFVNGNFAGYAEDSYTTSEFDVTKFLRKGKNTVALQVFKFTTGSYLEVQDMPHTYGILRDVAIFSRPEVFVRDYFADIGLSGDFKKAEINCAIEIENRSQTPKTKFLKCVVFDKNAKPFATLLGGEKIEIAANSSKKISKKFDVEKFKLWSADNPNLYKIAFILADENGENADAISNDIAFRKFEIKDKQLFLNGVRFFVKGVNRHNFSPEQGSAISFELIEKDISLIKEANINSIRTSHYPNDEKVYLLCDRRGIAVLDENNLESHSLWRHVPGETGTYTVSCLDRMRNMVVRDRNFPCVFAWSLGNENGLSYTKNHKAMELLARELDPRRYIHCEIATYHEKNTSDFISPMYGGVQRMQEYLRMNKSKPFMFCEYCFAIGNGIGNLSDVWDLARKEPTLLGGFIWDWADRTLYLPWKGDKNKMFLAYGPNFGTPRDAGLWCASGVVLGDRSLTPKYFEVQRVLQNIYIRKSEADPEKLSISNEFTSRDLGEFDAYVSLIVDGAEVKSKKIPRLSLPAGKSADFEIPWIEPKNKNAPGVYHKKISFVDKDGRVVATRQFFEKEIPSKKVLSSGKAVEIRQKDGKAELVSGGLKLIFDAENAQLLSIEKNGSPIISAPIELDIKAAWISNFGQSRREFEKLELNKMRLAKKSFKTQKLSANCARAICTQTFATPMGMGFEFECAYTMLGDRAVEAAVKITKINDTPEKLYLPRVGVKMGVSKDFVKSAKYMGRGPLMNYPDKLQAADFGVYNIDFDSEIIKYPKPQDCGNREGVKSCLILGEGGSLKILAPREGGLAMSMLPHTQQELEKARNYEDLPACAGFEFRIASKVCGVGNGALWLPTLDKYRPHFKGSEAFKFVMVFDKPAKNLSEIENFPQKFSFNQNVLADNLQEESLKVKLEGDWISENASISYSSVSAEYAPRNSNPLKCKGENFAFHTNRDDPIQYAIIDLGSARKVSGLRIFNRKDNEGNRTDRLRAFISLDGKNWEKVWESNDAQEMWLAPFGGLKNARYVKIQLDKKEYFHLSGIQVYGK